MSYIGKTPIVGNFQKCDALTASATADYTLQVSSTNVVPESANHMLVSLNGILQAPITSFSVSGSTLSFASSLTSNDSIDFVILLGNVLDLGTPSDGTVSNAKLGTDVISGETDIGGAIADADLFLLDDGAGGTLRKTAASRIKTYVGGGITTASQWRLTTNFTGDANPIASNLAENTLDGGGVLGSSMTESSGIFTFPSTGYWLIIFDVQASGTDARYHSSDIQTTTDNSAYSQAAQNELHLRDDANNYAHSSCRFIFDVTSTTLCKVQFVVDAHDSDSTLGSSSRLNTGMTFIRLGDT